MNSSARLVASFDSLSSDRSRRRGSGRAAGTDLGNTSSTHLGYSMSDFFCTEFGGQRLGRRVAEASEASRSGAAAKALRARCSAVVCFDCENRNRVLPLRCVGRWAHPSRVRVPELPNQQGSKIDRRFAALLRLEANGITHEGFSHETFSTPPANLSVGAHSACGPPLGIFPWCQARSGRLGPVHLRRHSIGQSGVRTDSVVGIHPAVDPSLLCLGVARRRPRHIALEHAVHLLVRSILLGMARFDELDPNPKRCPPGAQARQARRTLGTKWSAIVGPDDRRITVLTKQPQEHSPGRLPVLVRQHTHREDVTAEGIPDRQRIHPLAILGSKPTLEIHRPHLVAPTSHCQGTALEWRPAKRTAPMSNVELHPPQPFAYRPRRRNRLSGIFLAQAGRQFPAAPPTMPPSQASYPAQPLGRGLTWGTMRPARSVPQSSRAFSLETRHPLVARSAAHSKTTTQLRQALLASAGQFHELQPPHQSRDFFPRHARQKAEK